MGLNGCVLVSDITHCTAIFFLTHMLRGKPDYLFEKPEQNNQSRIKVSRVDLTSYDMIVEEKCLFHVKVENFRMCTCVDFDYAFAVMIALHYIFNVTYTKKIVVTMICVEQLLLEIHDYQKIQPKVLSLICKIKKDM